MKAPPFEPVDWDPIRLVVFDVDGTLYRQYPVRLRMLRDLLVHGAGRGDFGPLRVLASYRQIRERAAGAEKPDFEGRVIAETASATGAPCTRVASLVTEWIHIRPLRYLRPSRYAGVEAVFAGLRRHGKPIGVLSDYPARAKLSALDLHAEFVVAAGDDDIGWLKPNPIGLQTLLARAGVRPHEALMIGDRVDRDGAAAARAGVRVLIRSGRPIDGWQTFAGYDDAVFAPLLDVRPAGQASVAGLANPAKADAQRPSAEKTLLGATNSS